MTANTAARSGTGDSRRSSGANANQTTTAQAHVDEGNPGQQGGGEGRSARGTVNSVLVGGYATEHLRRRGEHGVERLAWSTLSCRCGRR